MMLAVLERRAGIRMINMDVYVSTVGGARLAEPACDLAVALSVASSATGWPIALDSVAMGEVGLAGEVRPVSGVSRRLSEAARLGFRHAIIPAGSAEQGLAPAGMHVFEVSDLKSALERVSFPKAV
jgi:DNA repair protein RadA/Sms